MALSIPLRTTLEAADAYVIAEAEWIRAAQARQAAREKRQEELPDKAAALARFTAMSDKVYPAFAGVLGGQKSSPCMRTPPIMVPVSMLVRCVPMRSPHCRKWTATCWHVPVV